MALHDGGLQFLEPNESDGEESSSLSFSDLPMAGQDTSDGRDCPTGCPRTPPESDPFEFFFHEPRSPSRPAEMCAAADVFHRGKLLPLAAPPPPRPQISRTHKPVSGDHRRPDAGEDLGRARRFWAGGGLTAEYRRLRRLSSESHRRDPSPAPARPRPRPRWYHFAFGLIRAPAAMEMRDIRSRQRRRSSPSPATAEPGGWIAGKGSRGPWKLLRSLSCKGVETAVVTAPLSFVS